MSQKIFVVTGANKGIGYAIVKGLAEKVENGIIYLGARNLNLGKTAQSDIEEELGDNKKSEIRLFKLEITDESHCKKFAEHLKTEHNGLDVLINNAGYAFNHDAKEPAGVQAEVTIGINYYGTKLVSEYLTPLIRKGGRVVNICSRAGVMKGHYDQKYIEKFEDVENLTVEDIDDFVEQYKKFAEEGTRRENGFPESAYRVSKTAEIAFTMLQSRELKSRNIKVNACCPGYVNTDMTNGKGRLTIEEGADTPIYLAIDKNAPNGKFVAERKEIDYLQTAFKMG